MSSDSLALLRRNVGEHYTSLAEAHYKHDLTPSDRDSLTSAAKTLSTYTSIGSAVGLSLGLLLAVRLRRTRAQMFLAFRAKEKPTHVQFANGRTEEIPDITPLLKPSLAGDIATGLFFAGGGLFVGGELGLLGGGVAAKSGLSKDPESVKRIQDAWRRWRAEVLREEASNLEKQVEGQGLLEKGGLDGFI